MGEGEGEGEGEASAPVEGEAGRGAPFWPSASKRFLPIRHEVSLASAEHSMMFLSGRPSILARAAATTSASAAAAGQAGHWGQVTTPAWGTGWVRVRIRSS